MNEKSRTNNAFLNIFFGFFAQAGIIILSFVGRRVFLHFLSADYLGINGLYTNILTVLSLGELGLDMVAAYSLYKPVAENNTTLVRSLVNYFKKIYYTLAFAILCIGIFLIPFLRYLVNSDLSNNELTYYYILFLLNSIVSYFVAHKIVLLAACQEQRIHKIVTLSSNLILQILHIVVLLIWRNFYVFIIATILSTILSNFILNLVCNKKHPEVFKSREEVKIDKRPIKKRIASAFLYKMGAVLVSSTDNILISVLVSTIAVGYYSNYYQVVVAIQSFISIITLSMISGIGNLSVKESNEEQAKLFDMLLLFYHLIAAIGLIGFSLLFNNLITLWLGSQYLFDAKTVFMIAGVFYITNAITPVWMIREANGVFNKVKFVLLARAAFNLVFSILFGMLWGTMGIFLATIVSLILTSFWIEPKIVSKDVLKRRESIYWFHQLKYFIVTAISFVICYFATKCFNDSILMLVVKAIIIIAITTILFVITNIKTIELSNLRKYLFKVFKFIKRK